MDKYIELVMETLGLTEQEAEEHRRKSDEGFKQLAQGLGTVYDPEKPVA